MKAFIWRVIIAAISVVMLWWILPLFLTVIGVSTGGVLLALIKACTACLAILYVLFGPAPPVSWP